MVREMKHTEIGDIPADWELQTFEETFSVLSNNTLSRDNLNTRGGAVMNIHYGDILTKFSEVLDCSEEEIPFVNDIALLTASTRLLKDGDIVIADTAEDETVGKVTEVQNLGDGKIVAGLHTIPCRVKKGNFAPGWLGYYMNSHMYHDQIIPFITGIKVSSISKNAIAETMIVVPPLEEQQAIVGAMRDIDTLLKTNIKQVNKKISVKNGLCQQLLTGISRLPEYKDSKWVCKKIGDLGVLNKNGINPLQHENELFWEYSMPAYDENMEPYRVSGRSMNSMRFSIMAPVLLFNKLNVRQKRVWFVEKCDEQSICSTEFLPFVSNKVDLYFLREVLLTDKVTYDFENMSTGTSNSQKRISPDAFLDYEIMIPVKKEEQEEIAAILRDVNDEIKATFKNIDKYTKIKHGMISLFLYSC